MKHFYPFIIFLSFSILPQGVTAQTNDEINNKNQQVLTPQRTQNRGLTPRKSLSKEAATPTKSSQVGLQVNKTARKSSSKLVAPSTTTSPDRTFARSKVVPPPSIITLNKKSIEEQIVDVEQEIDFLYSSNDPQKALKLEKLEKLLEKKKLEKFSLDK